MNIKNLAISAAAWLIIFFVVPLVTNPMESVFHFVASTTAIYAFVLVWMIFWKTCWQSTKRPSSPLTLTNNLSIIWNSAIAREHIAAAMMVAGSMILVAIGWSFEDFNRRGFIWNFSKVTLCIPIFFGTLRCIQVVSIERARRSHIRSGIDTTRSKPPTK